MNRDVIQIMRPNRMPRLVPIIALLGALLPPGPAGGTQPFQQNFLFQGRLLENGLAVDGLYNINVSLWDAPVLGKQIGSTVAFSDVSVEGGLFQLEILPQSFGADVFNGQERYLQLEAAPAGSSPA